MNLSTIIIISLGLAMDAFAVLCAAAKHGFQRVYTTRNWRHPSGNKGEYPDNNLSASCALLYIPAAPRWSGEPFILNGLISERKNPGCFIGRS